MKILKYFRLPLRVALILAFIWTLAACQPSVEERLARAEQYFADAEYRAAVIELKNAIRADASNPDARLLFARSAYQLADLQTAEVEYVRALELGADRPAVWLGYGRSLLEQGKAAVALERVVPNLSVDSNDIARLVFLGDVFSALGNLADADAYFRQALTIDATSGAALIGAAAIAEASGDRVTARSLVNEAVELNPDSALVWRAMGNHLRLRSSLDEAAEAAEAYMRSASAETPTTPLAHRFLTRVNLASALMDLRRFDEAKIQIDELASLLPGHPLNLFLRGRLAYGTGDFDIAQLELQKYMALIPSDMRAQAMLGAVNFSQNYFRQAEAYLQRAARQNIGGETTRRLLAETQLRLRKPGDAMESLKLIEQEGNTDAVLLGMLGRAQIGMGNTDAAIGYFDQSVAADPTNLAAQLSLATGLLAARQYDRAIEVLEGIPEQADSKYNRVTLLIAAYLQNGDRAAAVAVSDDLIRDNPNDAAAYAVAGVLRQSIDEADAAGLRFNDAINLDPANIAALYGLARLAMDRSDNADAEIWLNKVLDVDPAFVRALVSLSTILPKAGRYSELRARFAAAIEADPQALAPSLLHARVAIVNQKFAEALDVVIAAKEFHPDESKLTYAEGLALLGTGQREAGLRTLANAALEDPDDVSIQYSLAKARIQARDYHGALRAAERVRKLRPDDVRGLALQVNALANTDRRNEAREALAEFWSTEAPGALSLTLAGDVEMLDYDPVKALDYYEQSAEMLWNRTIVMRLVQAYHAITPADATAPLERWLSEHPDDTAMRRTYAQLLESQGNTGAAVSEYERLTGEGSTDAIALNNLAWQYAEEGRDGAVELAQRAHEILPNNGSITDTLGWILYRQGELSKALELLREARQQLPNDPEIRFHLATVLLETGNKSEADTELTELLRDNESFPSREQAEALARAL